MTIDEKAENLWPINTDKVTFTKDEEITHNVLTTLKAKFISVGYQKDYMAYINHGETISYYIKEEDGTYKHLRDEINNEREARPEKRGWL